MRKNREVEAREMRVGGPQPDSVRGKPWWVGMTTRVNHLTSLICDTAFESV